MLNLKFCASLSITIALMTSCNTNNSEQKAEIGIKGKWTQNQKQEFMDNCRTSAIKSYEDRGQIGDSTTITTLCSCAGQIIEKRYSPDESSNIPAEEGKAIMIEAAKNCLPQN